MARYNLHVEEHTIVLLRNIESCIDSPMISVESEDLDLWYIQNL